MTIAVRDTGKVLVAYRAPFAQGRGRVLVFEPQQTVSQIVASFNGLPPDFFQRGYVLVNGHELDRRHWSRIRIKAGQEVVFAYALAGGGGRRGGAGKAILGLVVAVATVLTAGAAAAGFFGAGAGTLFGAGTLSAKLLAGGISLIGSLAQSALSKPPAAVKQQNSRDETLGAASASGNVLGPGAPIARIIGTRRAYPMLAAQPITVREGRDEYAEAVFVLAGPHKIEDILIGDTAIEDAEDIEIQTREGWADDWPIDLITRYGVMKTPSLELSAHQVDGDEQNKLKNQTNPEKSLPQWHGVSSSAVACDEFRLDLTFPQGLCNADLDRFRTAFRVRMRKTSTDPWINLPEVHYASDDNKEIRANIILKWADVPENMPTIPTQEGWVTAFKETKPQTSPASPAWVADASFSAGSGNDYLERGTTSSNVRRVTLDQYDAIFYLDAGALPPGNYQVQVKRSQGMKSSGFSTSAYTYNGSIIDPFYYLTSGGKAVMAESRQNVADTVYLVRATSIFNSHPINGGLAGSNLTIIAARAKNRALDQLSALFSGYVKDWDGTGWNDWTTTSNPAPHFYDVLRGQQTPDPLDAELVDNDSIVDWRQACIDLGYTCDLICEGDQMSAVLEKIAGSGYARLRMSETWGIIRDYDRSDEDPVQVFTARNLRGFRMSKAFARLPDAFRVVWPDGDTRDARDEVVIFRPGKEDIPNPRIEEVTYDVYKTEAKAVQRGRFDLAQGEARSAFFSWLAPIESIVCQRGDLVGINHYVLERSHDAARIVDVEIVADEIVAFNLDAAVQVYDELDMLDTPDMLDVADMLLVGAQTSVSVRDHNSVIAQPMAVVGPSGKTDRLELVTSIPVELDDDDSDPLMREGNLAWVGQSGAEILRLIITDIKPGRDFVAQITAVDEAPELFAA